jgi:hypothetical protein
MRPKTMLMPLPHRFFHATLTALALGALACPAHAQHVNTEQQIVNLRLGQRILVDDGTCPAGEVKEVSGSKMTPAGIAIARRCLPRVPHKGK